MRFLSMSNLKKTIYYFERNGIKKTFYAVLERFFLKQESYTYKNTDVEQLKEQKTYQFVFPCRFSILVPAYETKEAYLRKLIESVLAQTYGDFELIIADAGKSGRTEQITKSYSDGRIVYMGLENNGGISENTNAALKAAKGDYIGLLDHDDFLEPDALFAMAKAIEDKKRAGEEVSFLYSDEDKCDSEGSVFFEPHRKKDFDLDLLLSNNYICHFLVMKAGLMKELAFRKEYDGAQDYDLILRAVGKVIREYGEKETKAKICHIPRILYHWRCHEESTAANPKSKEYAYNAGKRAIEAFLKEMGWKADVTETSHVGFYDIIANDILSDIGKVGAAGGKVVDRKGKIRAGIYREDGRIPFFDQSVHFSGYMHRAAMKQSVFALDLRCIKIRRELIPVFEEITGMKYKINGKTGLFLWKEYKKSEEEWKNLSMAFCKKVSEKGYRLIFVPDYICRVKRHGEWKWQKLQ